MQNQIVEIGSIIEMWLVAIIYTWVILKRYGIQKSYSDSFYRLTEENEKYGVFFTLFCWGFAFPAAILGSNVYITPGALLICGVGVARAFKDNKWMNFTHQFLAYTGILWAMYGIWVYYNMWYLTVTFAVGSILLFLFKKKLPMAFDYDDYWKRYKTEYTHIAFIEALAIIIIGLILTITHL